MTALEVRRLRKHFGATRAVRDVSFDVHYGEIVGLIGPDGAGKSTTMRMVVTLLTPDEGHIRFMDREAQSDTAFVRSHIGYMPQRFSLYQDLTVEQNMLFFADLFDVPVAERVARMERLYAFSRLGPFRDRLAGMLSGGMKQKLALSCMLIHQPRVIVLDEPTFGVDPVSRHEFWEILHTLRQEGVAILVSTAYMDEAVLCDRVALMHEGAFLAFDRPESIVRTLPRVIYRLETATPARTFQYIRENSDLEIQLFGDGLHIYVPGDQKDTLSTILKKLNIDMNNIQPAEPQLEDLFLYLMQEEAHG